MHNFRVRSFVENKCLRFDLSFCLISTMADLDELA